MTSGTTSITSGLTRKQAAEQLNIYGRNELNGQRRNPVLKSLLNIITEPMFILLAVACALYFALGDLTEAWMMVVSILFVAGIELYQETKSERALEALRKYTSAQVRVLREGQWIEIPSEELVPGDLVNLEEGERVPADGILLEQHDLSVDESVLTGESLSVDKQAQNRLFQGTTVVSGRGLFQVTETGAATAFGQLGKSIDSMETVKTPLQIQIKRFVTQMGIAGGLAFVLVFVLNYWLEQDIWAALLFSLTLAMAILPEEIPVAFSAFMGLGAYRMIQHGILAKRPGTVESLGSATVICLDKTGTITQNKMSVAEVQDLGAQNKVLEYALWASEPVIFDAMELAIMEKVLEPEHISEDPRMGYQIVHEYALSGRPPMMTHVWEKDGQHRVIACKGAVERVLEVSGASDALIEEVLLHTEKMAAQGFRVLGVASAVFEGSTFPDDQMDFPWQFEGLIAFYDPPKENVAHVFKQFYQAGLRVIMITGDHKSTAQHIARSAGLKGWEVSMTGQQIMDLSDTDLQDAVQRVNVFARMFPDAKLRVVNALKSNGEIVAMSGDGVNDGPALKSAQIGVAMGKKGTEIAKSAASLVLLEDDLQGMVLAIAMGRRIYDNLRKAIRYIISIHLPIVLMVLVPLLLGWPYAHILLPLHVIFLELVMDPTAAIAFENEPAEPNLMQKPPRNAKASLFSGKELGISLLQGAVITAGVLCMYQWAIYQKLPEEGVRSMVFATMVFANLFLTLANRSFDFALPQTIRYKNPVMPLILAISALVLMLILYFPWLSRLFGMTPLSIANLAWCLLAGFASVVWFECYKWIKNSTQNSKTD
ncbi:MAG TPA: cation-translocating P-type ATPase [Saprospiraceae bacterium]|nr:cation-translocating P-type ATPase [Saprospiraceae bacterium]